MSAGFEGKAALVTGGASGIGRATATMLAERGANVLIADLDEGGAAESAGGIDGAEAVGCDVGDPAAVEGAVNTAVERFGGLDILVNNAGIPLVGPLTEVGLEDITSVLRVNVAGVVHGIKYAAPRIAERGGGAIVSTASAAGLRGTLMQGVYGSSKAAVINLTQTAAIELRPLGIRVNCICPGIVRTPMLERIKETFESMTPVPVDDLVAMKQGRWAEPEDMARAICYLASDQADFISGVALAADNALSASLF